MTQPAVYFDLDGTLVDTTYFHAHAWWRALDEAGMHRPMAAIHPLIGMGSEALLTRLVGRSDEAIEAAHERHFSDLHSFVRPLPGAGAVLRRVVEAGAKAVVVTSAKKQDLNALLRPLGSDRLISDVIDGEQVGSPKPAPDPFAVALRRTEGDPTFAIAVGDSVWDVESATAVGMPCIGVQTGGIAAHDLEGAGAVAVYRDCRELLARWDSGPVAALLART